MVNSLNVNQKYRKYDPKKCSECLKNFQPTHHSNTLCSVKCRKISHNRACIKCNKARPTLGIRYFNCLRCGKRIVRKGNMQKYCGNRKDKKSCSYIKYRESMTSLKEKYSIMPIHFFNLYKNGAKKRNYEFKITVEDLMEFWRKPCYYCNSDIEYVKIDRVDNKKGYTLDNLVSCCWLCNQMKKAYTKELFINHCIKVSKNFRLETEGEDEEEKEILSQEFQVNELGIGKPLI
jgi:hypothetical protein